MKINSIINKISFTSDFNNYPDAVIVIDFLNNITQWNDKACKIFGYTQKEMMGRDIALIFDAKTEKIKEAVKSGRHPVISAKNSSNEDIFVEISCRELPEKKKILITARDVTKNQKVIEKLLFEYERAVKISTHKNTFITGLSNNLKTPIHSLIGFSQGLLDGICGKLNEKQFKYVTIMNKNANALLNLVSDFLELSRLEKDDLYFETKVFDLTKTLNQTCENLQSLAESKGLNFELDASDLMKKNIYTSDEFLAKAIFNLVENSVKFTDTGFIKVKIMHPDNDFVKTRGLEIPENFTDKSWLLFKITDTGIGMNEEELAVIFDEYSKLERNIAKKYGGTGFKMALTKKMITRVGGTIWAESELGQGSTFNFIIPIERSVNTVKSEELEEEAVLN